LLGAQGDARRRPQLLASVLTRRGQHERQTRQRVREGRRRGVGGELRQRVLVLPSAEQEVVAAADPGDPAPLRPADPDVRPRRGAVHLHAVLGVGPAHPGQSPGPALRARGTAGTISPRGTGGHLPKEIHHMWFRAFLGVWAVGAWAFAIWMAT